MELKPISTWRLCLREQTKKVGTLLTCLRRIFSPANFNQSRCRILVFASRRANKVVKRKICLIIRLRQKENVASRVKIRQWKTGLTFRRIFARSVRFNLYCSGSGNPIFLCDFHCTTDTSNVSLRFMSKIYMLAISRNLSRNSSPLSPRQNSYCTPLDTATRVKTHKLLHVCKQVVTNLFTSC